MSLSGVDGRLNQLLVWIAGRDCQVVVDIAGVRDLVRDFTTILCFSSVAVDHSAQGDLAIPGDDFYILGIHGHSVITDDVFANLRRGIEVGLVVALVKRRRSARSLRAVRYRAQRSCRW